MQPKEKLRRWREQNKKKGLCRYCNKKTAPGKTMCQEHLDYHKWRKRILRKKVEVAK